MSLYEELKEGKYLHPIWGMVANVKHQGDEVACDNYWLFTAMAMILASERRWPGSIHFYVEGRAKRGLPNRFPKKVSDISQQELAGCAALDTAMAIQIEAYGNRNFWCFNSESPGKFKINYFYGWIRFLDFQPFVNMLSAGCLDFLFLGKIFWAIGVLTTPLSAYENTSEKVYKWMQVERVRGFHPFTDLVIKGWETLMRWKYPGGPRELFSIYFTDPEHPFHRYAPLEF